MRQMVIVGYIKLITQLVCPYHFLVFVEFFAHAAIYILTIGSAGITPILAFSVGVVIAEC